MITDIPKRLELQAEMQDRVKLWLAATREVVVMSSEQAEAAKELAEVESWLKKAKHGPTDDREA